MQNLPANDVLLTGSRGTGKSSIVRALLTEYKDQGLRLIEIERDDLSDLPEIRSSSRSVRKSSLSTAMIWPLMLKMKTIAA
ncbi:DUF815 domain-containing protein [Acinetobacter baumannii]|nr:DUF815 domain-containing protein [Acinetobacter baumannii]